MGLVDLDSAKLSEFNAPDGPVVMLNLYRFKSQDHREKFAESMGSVVGPLLQKAGAEIVYGGSVAGEFVAGEQWDSIALVRYPSYRAFLEILADPDVEAQILELRRAMLSESRFMVTS